jgi:hypothetical protein
MVQQSHCWRPNDGDECLTTKWTYSKMVCALAIDAWSSCDLLLFTFYLNTTNSDKNTLFGTFLIKITQKEQGL